MLGIVDLALTVRCFTGIKKQNEDDLNSFEIQGEDNISLEIPK